MSFQKLVNDGHFVPNEKNARKTVNKQLESNQMPLKVCHVVGASWKIDYAISYE